MITRRAFLAGAACCSVQFTAFPPTQSFAAFPTPPLDLEVMPGKAKLLESLKADTPIWGYRGKVPGPVIKVKQGEEVRVRLRNSLSQPTTIHWHGIRIANAMDGVAGLTQDAVKPGEVFDYRFKAPDAGTFWYHPHNRSWEQMARGLYGALIVEEENAPDVDQDLVVIADDWRLEDDGAIHEASFGSIGERAHAGRLGNILTMNGKPSGEFPVRAGERNRVRLINTCNARILELRFEGLKPIVIAVDGQPVTPHPLENEIATLAPGQRVDLIVDMTGAPGSVQAITEVSQNRLVAGRFIYSGDAPLKRRDSDVALPSNHLVNPDYGKARMVDLVMAGGAMGQLEQVSHKGKDYSLRDLAREHGMVWAFNGVAGMADKPLFTANRGETIGIKMVNQTRWPHAMHFHGHHFREQGDGKPWHDTLLMERDETRTVYMVADNPGKWMLHCHMLEHQAGGMATWFEVK